MDGNRGAKGSIKDRLISMLYRMRYSKKKKKEEEYQIPKKQDQLKYIQNLQLVKETNNIDILEPLDINRLEDQQITIKYDVKRGIITESDITLTNIELKTSELDEKVDLKKEEEKTKEEVVILEEVNTFIDESKELLLEIEEEVKILKKASKVKNQSEEELKELEYRFKKLQEKVKKLKKQYDTIKNKYDLSDYSVLESINLMDNVKSYKDKASLNEMDMMVSVCKKEIEKIESIEVEYPKTEQIEENIIDVKDTQKKVKIKFNKNKTEINKIKIVQEEALTEIEKQEEVINKMYEEASRIREIVKKKLVREGKGNILSSIFRIATGVLTLPFNGKSIFGVNLGNSLINRGLRTLNQNFELKEKTYYEYEYTDLTSKLNNVTDEVEYTSLIISDNLNEINKLKENLKTYYEYENILSDYKNTFLKIDKIEANLLIQQERINKMKSKIDDEKTINKNKLDKVIKMKYNRRTK